MTTNIESADDAQTDPTGESEVIADFRRREKELKAQLKAAEEAQTQALVEARAQVKREAEASSLMSNAGFGGLADVFAAEVDGDLTPEAATEWLSKRGLAASSDTDESEPDPAEQVGEVVDLGSQVAAAVQDPTGGSFDKQLDGLEESAKGSLDAFSASVEELFK